MKPKEEYIEMYKKSIDELNKAIAEIDMQIEENRENSEIPDFNLKARRNKLIELRDKDEYCLSMLSLSNTTKKDSDT